MPSSTSCNVRVIVIGEPLRPLREDGPCVRPIMHKHAVAFESFLRRPRPCRWIQGCARARSARKVLCNLLYPRKVLAVRCSLPHTVLRQSPHRFALSANYLINDLNPASLPTGHAERVLRHLPAAFLEANAKFLGIDNIYERFEQ